MNLVYIHGAGATIESFNYIRQHLQNYTEILIEYDSRLGFSNNLEAMKIKLKNCTDLFFICHSLGGVYALHLADYFKKSVLGALTISTPYGGSKSAVYAKYFLPFNQLLRDITPNSKPIRISNSIKITHPWCNIVTTRGDCPWILEPNDGVVTIASMQNRKDMEFLHLYHNHYEVVISPKTVDIIKQKINEIIHRS